MGDSSVKNPLVLDIDKKKTDPNNVNDIFGKLGVDLSFMDDFNKLLGAFKDLTKPGGIEGFLSKQLGNGLSSLINASLDSVLATLQALESMAADIGNELFGALASQIYIPDEVFLVALQGTVGLGGALAYEDNYVRKVAIQHDMPKTLAWIDQQQNVTYTVDNDYGGDAFLAARSGAFHTACYILDFIYAERRSVAAEPDVPKAAGKAGAISKADKLSELDGFIYSVVKSIIVNSYSNLSLQEVQGIIKKYQINPSAYGVSDKQFNKRFKFNSGDIDKMAPIVQGGALGVINKTVNKKNTPIQMINPPNQNIKWIYIYLVSSEFGNFRLNHPEMYDRLRLPKANIITKAANKAGEFLLTTGLGAMALNVLKQVEASSYLYTTSVEKYIFTPSMQKYIDFTNADIPAPAPLPSNKTISEGEETGPLTPFTFVDEMFPPLSVKSFTVKREYILGSTTPEVINGVHSLMKANSFKFYDYLSVGKIVSSNNGPVTIADNFYIFSNPADSDFSMTGVQKEQIVAYSILMEYGVTSLTSISTMYPSLVAHFTYIVKMMLQDEIRKKQCATSLDDLVDQLKVLIKLNKITITGILNSSGQQITYEEFGSWFIAKLIAVYAAGDIDFTNMDPKGVFTALLDAMSVTHSSDLNLSIINANEALAFIDRIMNRTIKVSLSTFRSRLSTTLMSKLVQTEPDTYFEGVLFYIACRRAYQLRKDLFDGCKNSQDFMHIIYYDTRVDGSYISDTQLQAQGIVGYQRTKKHTESIAARIPGNIGTIVKEDIAKSTIEEPALDLMANSDPGFKPNIPKTVTRAQVFGGEPNWYTLYMDILTNLNLGKDGIHIYMPIVNQEIPDFSLRTGMQCDKLIRLIIEELSNEVQRRKTEAAFVVNATMVLSLLMNLLVKIERTKSTFAALLNGSLKQKQYLIYFDKKDPMNPVKFVEESLFRYYAGKLA